MTSLALIWDLIARDGASANFNKVAASADRAAASTEKSTASLGTFNGAAPKSSDGISDFAKKAGAALGALATIDFASHLVGDAVQFQKSMLLVQTQAGASSTEVKKMSSAILGLAGSVGTGPEQLATSLFHVESTGLRGAAALDAVKTAAEGAKVGNADLEQTTNALTSTVVSGIGGFKNLGQAMGALNAIVGVGDMHLGDLNDALTTGVFVTAKTFGVSLAQAGAALADFGDEGIRGAKAGQDVIQTMRALADPAKGGAATLAALGLSATKLGDDLRHGGITTALADLRTHLNAAGDTGSKVGAVLTSAFGKKAGVGISILENDLDRLPPKVRLIQTGAQNFAAEWDATKKTTAFALDRISASFQSVEIEIGTALLPAVNHAITGFFDLMHQLEPVGSVLGGTVKEGFSLVASSAGSVASALGPLKPLLGDLAGPLAEAAAGALTLWAGFKAGDAVFNGVKATIGGISSAVETATLKTLYMGDAVGSLGNLFKTSAAASVEAGSVIEGEAAATAASVAASGEAATVAWAELAGPIGAAALGVFALVSLFNRSTGASKEATAAAKAYSDALSSGGGKSSQIDAITSQLSKNDLPATLNTLNAALGKTAFTGQQFVTAINDNGKPLDALRARLEAVAAQTERVTVNGQRGTVTITKSTPAAIAAAKALGTLNTQYTGLSKTTIATAKDLANTKAFAGVSSSIKDVAASLGITTAEGQSYAAMMGILGDSNTVTALSSKALKAAIDSVKVAYDNASQSGNDFLDAYSSFAQSTAGQAFATTAQTAALIGATLKAANGDALGFASTLNASAVASSGFIDSMKQAANAVGKHGESTKALLASIVNLKTGTINYSKTAAEPLISGMQSIQQAGLAAAEAQYQLSKSTGRGAQAADDAYTVYKNQTGPSLDAQFEKLGLTSGQAQKLTDKYLGIPKNIKTLIAAEGTDPVVTVLDRIGALLAKLTGTSWDINVNANTGAAIHALAKVRQAASLAGNPGNVYAGYSKAAAGGGAIFGPGSGTSDSINARLSNGEHVWTAAEVHEAGGQGAMYRARAAVRSGMLKFAGGGGIKHVGSDWIVDSTGVRYASERAAQNGAAAAAKSISKKVASTLAGYRSTGISSGNSALSDLGVTQQVSAPSDLAQALAAVTSYLRFNGDSAKDAKSVADQLRSDNTNIALAVKARAKIVKDLATANDNLTSAKQNRSGEYGNVSSSLLSGASLASNSGYGGDTASIKYFLASKLAAYKQFSVDERAALAHGVDPTLVQQMVDAGVDAAGTTLHTLATASLKDVKSIDALQGNLTATSKSIASYSAHKFYDSGVSSAQGIVDGFASKKTAADSAVKKLADSMVKTFRAALGIHSPSTVFRAHGHNIADGLILGLGDRSMNVQSAIGQMGGYQGLGGRPGSSAQFDRLIALLEKSPALRSRPGPLVHVEQVSSGVDLDMWARQAEFKQRMGSF